MKQGCHSSSSDHSSIDHYVVSPLIDYLTVDYRRLPLITDNYPRLSSIILDYYHRITPKSDGRLLSVRAMVGYKLSRCHAATLPRCPRCGEVPRALGSSCLSSLSLLLTFIIMASTRWFNLFFPAKPPPERHCVDYSPAASLPPELLLEIFTNVARSARSPDRDTVVYPTLDELERSSRHPLAGALRTCSAWTGSATVALYHEIGTFPVLSHTHTPISISIHTLI